MQPQFATIQNWVSISGISRSQTYNLIAAGHIKTRKVMARTLIDVPAGLEWIKSQPAADITLPCRLRKAA